MQQAVITFVENPGGKHQQRERVHKCRQHAGALIAKSLDLVSWFGLQIEAKPGKGEREGVGNVMAGVGDQRQAMRLDPGDELDQYKEGSGKQGPCQNFPSPMAMAVRMQRELQLQCTTRRV